MSDNAGNENKDSITINEKELKNAFDKIFYYDYMTVDLGSKILFIAEKKSVTFKNINFNNFELEKFTAIIGCLLYTSTSQRD